jgi:hypothetical protein
MPRIAIYLKSETPFAQAASHSATQTMWACVVADRSGKQLKQDVGQLLTDETWRQVKDRLRPSSSRGKLIPRLKAIGRQFNLDLNYPHKGQESVRHPHEAFRRECRLAQARKDQLKLVERASAQAQAAS